MSSQIISPPHTSPDGREEPITGPQEIRKPSTEMRPLGLIAAFLIPVFLLPSLPVFWQLRSHGKQLASIQRTILDTSLRGAEMERAVNQAMVHLNMKDVVKEGRLSVQVQTLRSQLRRSRKESMEARRRAALSMNYILRMKDELRQREERLCQIPKDEISSSLAEIASFMEQVERERGQTSPEDLERVERIRRLARKLQD